ncbi:MAG: ankyrin repeat domain-containing protein [Pirellulales bacterium]
MPKTSEFIKACHNGVLADAQKLLADSDINGANEHGQGALLTFHAVIIGFLLENGADPNRQRNENGASVLAGLCYAGKLDCVKLLLSNSADPNLGRLESGETPLHHALTGQGHDNEQLQIVTALLATGANPNQKAEIGVVSYNFMRDVRVRGETPLHRAAAYASKGIVEALLAAGADRSIRDANGDSPLSWGSLHLRDSDLLKLLCFDKLRIR